MGIQGGNSWSRIQQHLYYNPRLQEAAIKHQPNENKRLVIFFGAGYNNSESLSNKFVLYTEKRSKTFYVQVRQLVQQI